MATLDHCTITMFIFKLAVYYHFIITDHTGVNYKNYVFLSDSNNDILHNRC